MEEVTGDIWEKWDEGGRDAIVIPTNGYVREDGANIMGAGLAKDAADRYPDLPWLNGKAISRFGVGVFCFPVDHGWLVTFPVKPASVVSADPAEIDKLVIASKRGKYAPGQTIPGWAMKARLWDIKRGVSRLSPLSQAMRWEGILIPRLGCGRGELSWDEVRPAMAESLDARFIVVFKERAVERAE